MTNVQTNFLTATSVISSLVTTTLTNSADVTVTTQISGVASVSTVPVLKRQVTIVPSSVPSYAANACHNNVASYKYACSCVGASATVITAPAPVVALTVSATATATSTATHVTTTPVTSLQTATATTLITRTSTATSLVPTATSYASAPSTFYLRDEEGKVVNFGSWADPQWIQQSWLLLRVTRPTVLAPEVFAIDAAGTLFMPATPGPRGGRAVVDYTPTWDLEVFDDTAVPTASYLLPRGLKCALLPGTLELACTVSGVTVAFAESIAAIEDDGIVMQWWLHATGYGTPVTIFASCGGV